MDVAVNGRGRFFAIFTRPKPRIAAERGRV
jgi:hypothetical protein